MSSFLKVIMLSLVMLVLSSCALTANRLEHAENLYRTQDYHSAFEQLFELAHHGDPVAEYAVAYMYYYGQGVVENTKKAEFWLAQSADHGNPDALRALNMLHTHAHLHPSLPSEQHTHTTP